MKSHYGCLNCKERAVGCHATCEQYIKESERIAEEKRRIKEKTRGDVLFREYRTAQQPKIYRQAKSKRGK